MFFLTSAHAAGTEPQTGPIFITIGTGSANGIYYPVGRTICDMLRHDTENPRLLCSVERTAGSTHNLKYIAVGGLEFGLSQSDQLGTAFKGTGEFKSPINKLRTVLSLYNESLTVIVRADSSYHKFSDLKHKKISTGLPGSGGNTTMHVLMNYMNWDEDDIDEVASLSNIRALTELGEKRVDAMVCTTGHPYKLLTAAAGEFALRLIPVKGAMVESLLKDSFAYNRTVIPGGFYRGITDPVESFGVVATLVSSSEVDKAIVYRVVKAIFDNLDEFRKADPLLDRLTRINMARRYRFAPLHAGSIEYFLQNDLLDETTVPVTER
jgi:TRAP transporter TAXI family solute receptor